MGAASLARPPCPPCPHRPTRCTYASMDSPTCGGARREIRGDGGRYGGDIVPTCVGARRGRCEARVSEASCRSISPHISPISPRISEASCRSRRTETLNDARHDGLSRYFRGTLGHSRVLSGSSRVLSGPLGSSRALSAPLEAVSRQSRGSLGYSRTERLTTCATEGTSSPRAATYTRRDGEMWGRCGER